MTLQVAALWRGSEIRSLTVPQEPLAEKCGAVSTDSAAGGAAAVRGGGKEH